MFSISPYIHFNGNAEEVVHFYRSVFGGEFTKLFRFSDLSNTGIVFPEKEAKKIMQNALPIGDSPWDTYFAMFRDRYGIEWMTEAVEK
ncbi:MAG: hypothetical protein ACKO6Q_04350 [Bacteroidota bacterium]